MFSRLITALRSPGTVPNDLGRASLVALQERVETLERSEVVRLAEHSAMIDRLERLYKRVSVRIARERPETLPTSPESILGQPESTESVLSLRQRLGRR